MSVIIEPSEQLEFHGPFTRISKELLVIKNPGSIPIIFKIKTTAPKQYCVRPNAGRIEPNSEVELQIILQPLKEELPADYHCKDKFLVQTAPMNESYENQEITAVWSTIETTEKQIMSQHKIKCVFVTQHQGVVRPTEINHDIQPDPIASESTSTVPGESSQEVPSIVEHKTLPEIVTEATKLKTETVKKDAPLVTSVNRSIVQPPTVSHTPVTTQEQKPTTTSVPKPPIPATEEPSDELRLALNKIKDLEKRLNEMQRLNEEGLRNRNKESANKVQPLDAVHQHLAALEKPRPTEGYPPQVVFGIAFFVFIFTYIFF
ncbi:PapD-like protein [Pilobolus umbonatus]|nr:PapD-like protein [Pilobolus umbonatus]